MSRKKPKPYKERFPADPKLLEVVTEAAGNQAAAQAAMSPEERERALAHVRKLRMELEQRKQSELVAGMAEIKRIGMEKTGMTMKQIEEEALRLGYATPGCSPPIVRNVEDAPPRPGRAELLGRGVPPKHIKGIYDRDPIDCTALRAVRAFLAAEQQVFLLIAGCVGTRKSGSACWGLTQVDGSYFVYAHDLVKLAVSTLQADKDTWARVLAAPLLLVDELGWEYVDDKGMFVQKLNQLIEHRDGKCLKTIFTYNHTADRFAADYTERAFERIREDGVVVDIEEPSVRGPAGEHWSNR